ncbi:MAG TPA: hypothetical protein VMZ91_01615 [Candidatus Paceibacterota bacterium]|nr:hypothetical protein [Candidatus Paceibacterota bacterium]
MNDQFIPANEVYDFFVDDLIERFGSVPDPNEEWVQIASNIFSLITEYPEKVEEERYFNVLENAPLSFFTPLGEFELFFTFFESSQEEIFKKISNLIKFWITIYNEVYDKEISSSYYEFLQARLGLVLIRKFESFIDGLRKQEDYSLENFGLLWKAVTYPTYRNKNAFFYFLEGFIEKYANNYFPKRASEGASELAYGIYRKDETDKMTKFFLIGQWNNTTELAWIVSHIDDGSIATGDAIIEDQQVFDQFKMSNEEVGETFLKTFNNFDSIFKNNAEKRQKETMKENKLIEDLIFNIDIDKDQEQEEPETIFHIKRNEEKFERKMKVAKALNGSLIIADYIDVDIVIDPNEKKIYTFSREEERDLDLVYDTQNRFYDFLIRRGIVDPKTVQGSEVYASMEAKYFVSNDEKVNENQATLYAISDFLADERPYYLWRKEQEENLIDWYADPDEEYSTELGEVPQANQKGTIDAMGWPAGAAYRIYESLKRKKH